MKPSVSVGDCLVYPEVVGIKRGEAFGQGTGEEECGAPDVDMLSSATSKSIVMPTLQGWGFQGRGVPQPESPTVLRNKIQMQS